MKQIFPANSIFRIRVRNKIYSQLPIGLKLDDHAIARALALHFALHSLCSFVCAVIVMACLSSCITKHLQSEAARGVVETTTAMHDGARCVLARDG